MSTISTTRRTGNAENTRIEVSVLGGFEVFDDDRPILFTAMASRLIAYLAVRQRCISRATIAGILWPENTQVRAQASLRTTLWRMRNVHDGIVMVDNEYLDLTEGVMVDIDTLSDAALNIGKDPGLALGCGAPISWFSCELLPDWYDDWIVLEREHCRLMALHALEWRSAWYLDNGDFAFAAECALAAVHLAPLRESSYRALMKANIANGNMTEAINQYRRYRDLLLSEVHIEPTDQMRALLEGVNLATITNVA